MRGEYASYVKDRPQKSCSTCSIFTDQAALFGHNEDGLKVFKDHLFFVKVNPENKRSFTALTYPGFICGNSLGFNSAGICFSINNVNPIHVTDGVGRHFIARSLFEARNLDEAIKHATPTDRASGFNYTIASISERRIVNVEVAPDQHHVREITGSYFHANHYLEIEDIPQNIKPSSRARCQRAKILFEKKSQNGAQSILDVLTDQQNTDYPVYRSSTPPDEFSTLLTSIFDLDARTMSVYDNPPFKMHAKLMELAIERI
jgi:hypothetical protein